MSQQKEESIAGRAVIELRNAIQRLDCLEAKAQDICSSLNTLRTLLCPEDSGRLRKDVPELPTADEVKRLLAAIRQQQQIIKDRSSVLRKMGCPVSNHVKSS